MNRYPVIRFLAVLLVASALLPNALRAAPLDEAAAVLDQAIDAFNGRDYARYEALVTEDLEGYAGVVTPLRFIGRAKWMAFIRGMDALASANYDQRHRQCRSYNDDAVVCNSYFVFTTVDKQGVLERQSGRESTTLVRVGGRWLIANFHFSAFF